jgi:hypothetical protein
MVKKVFFTLGTAAIFLLPSGAMSQGQYDLFDQFKNTDVTAFQGVFLDQEMTIESYQDSSSVQGINVITGYTAGGKVVQTALVEADLSLDLSHGKDAVQGVNVYQGDFKDKISQMAIINGTVTMSSEYNDGGIQGINVITGAHCN